MIRAVVSVLTGIWLCIGQGRVSSAAGLAFRETPPPRRYSRNISETQLERLRRVMLPLLRATDQPSRFDQVRVRIIDDPSINAGSLGGGEFILTSGLLNRASDDHLRGVLAHEIAHDCLGHPARAQMLGLGVGLGTALLQQIFPGSAAVAPIAGSLVTAGYSRPQEYEADRLAVKILQRSGYSKDIMIDTLAWLVRLEGNTGGGLLSTHPATSERIRALQAQR